MLCKIGQHICLLKKASLSIICKNFNKNFIYLVKIFLFFPFSGLYSLKSQPITSLIYSLLLWVTASLRWPLICLFFFKIRMNAGKGLAWFSPHQLK